MRTIPRLFSIAVALLLCSIAAADDVPDFLAMAPSGYAAQSNDIPDFSGMDATAAEAGDDCPCFEMLHCPTAKSAAGDCNCDDCACTEKTSRTVTKPAGVTMRLSAEAQARHDRRMAKGGDERQLPANDRQLPADDPPPRPELTICEPPEFEMVPFANEPLLFLKNEWRDNSHRERLSQELETARCPAWVVRMYRESPELMSRIIHGYRLQRSANNKSLSAGDREYYASQFKLLRVKNPAFAPPPPPQSAPSQQSASTSPRRGYPIRPGFENLRREVNHPGHLREGIHAGKFPADWLAGLTVPERESLHMDDHAGRVKWEYVPGHQQQASAAAPRREPIYEEQKFCTPFGCYKKNVLVGYRNVN